MLSFLSLKSTFTIAVLVCSLGTSEAASHRHAHLHKNKRAHIHSTRDINEGSFRELKAASKAADLLRRDSAIAPSFSAELSYAEENDGYAPSNFASSVTVLSDSPVVNLEDIEDRIKNVKCAGDSIKIEFHDAKDAASMKHVLSDSSNASVITSHEGCNEAHERAVYRVHSVAKGDKKSLDLDASRATFEKAFKSVRVKFGETHEPYHLRGHRIARRQAASANSTATQTTGAANVSGSASPVPQVQNVNLTHDAINKTLPVPPEVPLTLVCVNCSTSGLFEITHGDFNIDLNVFDGDGFNFIQNGTVNVTANNVGAHLEMSATPTKSSSVGVPLPALPIPGLGFVLPGVGRIGLTYSPELSLTWTVSGAVTVTYGMEAKVPTGSTISIDFTDPDNSVITGFNQTTIDALPYSANDSANGLSIKTSFTPQLQFGFQFLEGKAGAEAGLFSDLPYLQSNFTEVSGSEANCSFGGDKKSSQNNNPDTMTPAERKLLSAIGNVTEVDSEVGLAMGYKAEFDLPGAAGAAANKLGALNTAVTLLSTATPLPTTCLSAQPNGNLVPISDLGGQAIPTPGLFAPEATSQAAAGGYGSANPSVPLSASSVAAASAAASSPVETDCPESSSLAPASSASPTQPQASPELSSVAAASNIASTPAIPVSSDCTESSSVAAVSNASPSLAAPGISESSSVAAVSIASPTPVSSDCTESSSATASANASSTPIVPMATSSVAAQGVTKSRSGAKETDCPESSSVAADSAVPTPTPAPDAAAPESPDEAASSTSCTETTSA